jgi:hypothetical protein
MNAMTKCVEMENAQPKERVIDSLRRLRFFVQRLTDSKPSRWQLETRMMRESATRTHI